MSTLYQPGQHPDADQLSAFVDDALPGHEREETLAHLATCPECREIVALSMPPVEETLPAPKPARKWWFSGWRLVLAGAIAAPVLACLLLFVLHQRKAPENIAVAHPQPALQTAVEAPEVKKVAPPTHPALAKPATPAKTPAPAPTIAMKSIENLPLQGRNFAPTAPVAGVMGGLGAGTASDQIVDKAVNQPLQEPKRALAMASRQTARVIPMAPLPSSLPMVSTAVNGTRVLALDTQSALFRSEDAGQHWSAVPAAWTGRVLRVGVAGVTRVAAYAAPPAAPALKAQTYAAAPSIAGSATLSGTVIDATGAAIPGAVVTVASRTVKADASGHYVISNLEAGSYTLEASSPGFARLTQPVSVIPTGPTVADLRLSVGSVSQSVMVTSASSAIELIPTPSVGSVPAPPPVFELTTESGEHWTSTDGQTWMRK
jgi:hypothetical protein